jgi:hypothetical protein
MSCTTRVFVLPGGKIQIFVDNGTEEEARTATRSVLAQLQTSGIPFSEIGDIEVHRTGGTHVHIVNEVKHEQRHD